MDHGHPPAKLTEGFVERRLPNATRADTQGASGSGAVPSNGCPAWFVLDPASVLITGYLNEDPAGARARTARLKYFYDDANKAADLARSRRGIGTLHEATGGDLEHSYTYPCLQEYGLEQEVRVALRDRDGGRGGC